MGSTSIEYDDSPCLFDTEATREQQNVPSTTIPSRPAVLTPFDRSSNTSANSSSSTSPSRACPSISSPSPSFFLADPYANARSLSQTAIFTVLLHNALSLGFDLAALADCGNPYACLSPFYSTTATAQDDPCRLVADALARATPMATTTVVPPISLRPTLAQILVPHHASLDLIPFPQFRDRVILLSAALPHQFNLMELKKDIYVSGALRVAAFANDDGSAVCGRQSRQPWEPRSWEVRGWFLKKWSLAINSDRTEMT
ncbi:hypothetical protein PG993_010401 [Apiospora rasikravindrae]|uniref:Uncharacterized protein n=1 Tax=Apiospora rasikravindrae TaxID=990691 RepID=A0ABR1SNG5_9PEZI